MINWNNNYQNKFKFFLDCYFITIWDRLLEQFNIEQTIKVNWGSQYEHFCESQVVNFNLLWNLLREQCQFLSKEGILKLWVGEIKFYCTTMEKIMYFAWFNLYTRRLVVTAHTRLKQSLNNLNIILTNQLEIKSIQYTVNFKADF